MMLLLVSTYFILFIELGLSNQILVSMDVNDTILFNLSPFCMEEDKLGLCIAMEVSTIVRNRLD